MSDKELLALPGFGKTSLNYIRSLAPVDNGSPPPKRNPYLIHRMIQGDTFIQALINAGIADKGTTKVIIKAEVGTPTTISVETRPTEGGIDLAALIDAITFTDDPDEALCP